VPATPAALANAEPPPAPPAPGAAVGAPPAPANVVATSSQPPPVRQVKTASGVIELVDVRIDSRPSGATVMLVDRGKTSFLGSTPLATSLDPSRKYDVIFTLPGRPTQMAPLDPSRTSRLDVTLGRTSGSRATRPAGPRFERDEPKGEAAKLDTKVAPKLDDQVGATPARKAEPTPDKRAAEPKRDKKSAEPKAAGADEEAGEGTLMVSSKPPCEIWIDGKATGLTTPQRSISLPAGTHEITFVNPAERIKKTVSVAISAGQATKLIQDLMKK
jgi:hypothetical protein